MSVVVSYTPSPQGKAALAAGIRAARRRRTSLIVASHAYSDADAGRTTASAEDVARAIDALEPDHEGVEVEVRPADVEDVADFLLALTEETASRLLVIGLRGSSPMGKLNLGATARRVILSATCPVLAVKDSSRPTD